METKICRTCKQEKPLSKYYKQGAYYFPNCIPCCLQRAKLQKKGFSSPEGSKECKECGVTKPLSAFARHQSTVDGHRNVCRECVTQLAQVKAVVGNKPPALSTVQENILRALRQNGLTFLHLSERLGPNGKNTLYRLVKLGLIATDGNGFYELTEAGRLACPCRNPYFAKRLQAHHAQGKGAQ